MYLIPGLKKLLVPRVAPQQGKELCEQDSYYVARLAEIMKQYGLRFDLHPRLSNETQEANVVKSSIPLYPGIHLIHEYNLGSSVFVPEEARHCINLKIESLRHHSHIERYQSSGHGARLDKKGDMILDAKHLDDGDDEGATSDSGSVDPNTVRTPAPRVEHKCTSRKRPSTWLDVHRKEKRKRFMIKAQSTHKPPLTFYYDEGKTDAVRRAATLQDFL